ncbi:predicted protein [Naegleria gruberi]|uniref:Predicted protein n=1 Tax=Naegleria gruberi TaxID=5762 RepID=D2VYQ5_NAEGR|nr:uncharacterized protein NAEGRDRAFT_74204 [Naegleria gruberi]EFC37952.1 predicted protein [Naegleria gruberi]|eukprot:XP_002670696.1 predicted protein [Naegleria gruberi strain NEG-M]
MEWKLNYSSSFESNLHISISKSGPTFCVAIQLFSDQDSSYIHVNQSLNFITKDDILTNVTYRMFCYYQNVRIWDYEKKPASFCFTKISSTLYRRNCTGVGKVNEKLDEMIANGDWNFTLRKPFQQFYMKMTDLNIDIPLKLDNLTGLQMHVMLIDHWAYPEEFYLSAIKKPYYIIPLLVNYTDNETIPYWDSQCDDYTYSSRAQYFIWKMAALVFGLVEYSIMFILLIIKRKHRVIESRFIIPIFSMGVYILRCLINIALNIAYYDPEFDTLIEHLVIVLVMSLHMLQGIRYYLSRFFYSKYYSKRDSVIMKILLSKISILIEMVLVIVCEVAVVSVLVIYSFNDIPPISNALAVSCCVGYFILLSIGVIAHFCSNIEFVKKIKRPKQIFKWFFIHDDPFGYNGEFLILTFLLIVAGIHYGLSEISGGYLTLEPMDGTRPINRMYLNNGFGYFLYGSSKILLTLSYGLQSIFLISLTFRKVETPKYDLKEQKEEMDLFLSKVFQDGTSCVEIFKRFLITEFKMELLEIYTFLTKYPKSTVEEYLKISPQTTLFVNTHLRKRQDVDTYQEVSRQLLEIFNRMKQTIVYEEEYMRRKKKSIRIQ